jgi:hypothetical protein
MMLLALMLAAAPVAETPKAFLQRVYASYSHKDFSPFAHADRYFSPQLKAAMDEDARLAHGEVGYVDGDPICQCQDADGLHARVLRVRLEGPGRAIADVLLDYTDSTARRIQLSLLRTKAGWRIADVRSSDEPSLLRAIERSNRNARAKH